MYDRRVFRGSTTAAMAMPSNNYSDQIFVNKKERAKAKAQADVTPAADYVSPVSTVMPLEVSSSFSPPAPTKKRPRVEEGKPTVPSPFA